MSFFSYLAEFWDSIAAATEGTVEWFQSLGNAVAGAMGSLLTFLLQPFLDLVMVFTYYFHQIYILISALWAIPAYYIKILTTFFDYVGNWNGY